MSAFGAPRFFDRTDAGRILARQVSHLSGQHPLVLGIPRGGVPVAAEVARTLGADLDVCVARKLRAPGAAELAVGATTSDGALHLNQDIVARFGVTPEWISGEARVQAEEALRQERILRRGKPGHSIAGRLVIVVDDGLCTGATIRSAMRSLRARGARRVIVAVPVAAEGPFRTLQRDADELFCPSVLRDFGAVGSHYVHFEPVEDPELIVLLEGIAPAAHT